MPVSYIVYDSYTGVVYFCLFLQIPFKATRMTQFDVYEGHWLWYLWLFSLYFVFT